MLYGVHETKSEEDIALMHEKINSMQSPEASSPNSSEDAIGGIVSLIFFGSIVWIFVVVPFKEGNYAALIALYTPVLLIGSFKIFPYGKGLISKYLSVFANVVSKTLKIICPVIGALLIMYDVYYFPLEEGLTTIETVPYMIIGGLAGILGGFILSYPLSGLTFMMTSDFRVLLGVMWVLFIFNT